MNNIKRWQRQVGLGFIALVLSTVFSMAIHNIVAPEAAVAQLPNRRAIATAVYEQLPDLPMENHYVSTETGDVETTNTLVYRLLQYHLRVQSRPLGSRFDWKLTLADYLGANEWMDDRLYPDRFLETNPYSHDIEVVRTFNRQQRDDLVSAILSALDAGL